MRMFKLLAFGMFIILGSTTSQAETQPVPEIEPFSQAELEQILAPIALYPDTVLSHILIAATYPLEVIQAERWTIKYPDIKGSDAVEAVTDKDWDPSVKALVAFPEVLKRLSENLEWTQKLGDAFLQDEAKLLASVQSLRQRAYEAGSLDDMEKVSVTHEDDSIVIEPVEREVVYVPYYDTRVVYGPWYWSHYPPVYWNRPYYVNSYYAGHHSPFYWGPSVHVSFGFFFSSFHWHNHHVIRIPYHHYRPHHYYDRHQIASHQHVTRWTHNPTHRRGVSYRSVTVSNRYSSNRASQAEIRTHRNARQNATSERDANRRVERAISDSRRDSDRNGGSSTRIATPDRIREELRDGRISVKERNNRPTNRDNETTRPNTRNNDSSSTTRSNNRSRSETTRTSPPKRTEPARTNRSSGQKEQSQRTQSPPKQESRQRSQPRESSSKPASRSSSRPSSRSSSPRKSSGSRSSGSNKSNRSGGKRDGRG